MPYKIETAVQYKWWQGLTKTAITDNPEEVAARIMKIFFEPGAAIDKTDWIWSSNRILPPATIVFMCGIYSDCDTAITCIGDPSATGYTSYFEKELQEVSMFWQEGEISGDKLTQWVEEGLCRGLKIYKAGDFQRKEFYVYGTGQAVEGHSGVAVPDK
ncbi:hypothetical protein EJ08DRAFT_702733 [Tothia fuscella]|uniref:Uncharacterized protein n=1 Tax=Tothia fuscella TaxID=1048955 RepID=A0A9P4NFN8_9PEZI|nr:hypothetical protein EJ08DRAFT_702733 [Tothia fuscella]